MLKIEVNRDDCAVWTQNITNRAGNPMTLYSQNAYVWKEGHPYPEKVRVPLQQGQSAYEPGRYSLDPACFVAGRFGDLEINRYEVRLLPFAASAQQAKSA